MKITLGQQPEVLTPYQARATLELKSHLGMSEERLTKYQAILLESSEVTIKTCTILNPASLLPSELMTEHTCEQVIIQTYASRWDLKDQPLLEPEAEWFADGSSFVLNGERKAGYTVMNHEEVRRHSPCQLGLLPKSFNQSSNSGRGKKAQYLYQLHICLPGIACSCSYVEEMGTPLQEGIPNKTWKGNSPILRGYPPTKGSGSDSPMGISKRPNSGDTGKQPDRPKG
jgi:hypothetical protein